METKTLQLADNDVADRAIPDPPKPIRGIVLTSTPQPPPPKLHSHAIQPTNNRHERRRLASDMRRNERSEFRIARNVVNNAIAKKHGRKI